MADRKVTITLDADPSPFIRGFAAASAAAKGFAKDLDSTDSRMGNLVQTGLALAPALVPIGGAAVAGIVALGAGLASAAGAAAVAVLAFQGVGTALTAVNAFSLDPTLANFEAMQAAMEQLGPAGQNFVMFLQDLRPEIQGLQNLAQAGLFPGVQDGLTELMTNMPIAEDFVRNFSSTMGDLAADGGARLADPWWQDFFKYISTTGPQILSNFTRATGNVVEGLAGMLQAFDPLSQGFAAGLLDMSASFADWGRGLGETQGFQDFVAYIQDTGPQVLATLESLGGALVQLVEAAAPIGGIALKGIEILGDVVGAVADSSIGPGLIATAAGLAAISRGIALYNVANGSALVNLLGKTGLGTAATAAKTLPAAAAGLNLFTRGVSSAGTSLGKFGPQMKSFGNFATYMGRATDSTGKFVTASSKMTTALTGAAPLAAGVAGGLLLMDQAGRQAGSGLASLETVAGGALLGFAVGGPIGAALGAGAGLIYDVATASSTASESLDKVKEALGTPSDLAAVDAALNVAKEQVKAAQDTEVATDRFQGIANATGSSTNEGLDNLVSDLSDAQIQAGATAQGISDLSQSLGQGKIDTSDIDALTLSAQKMAPIFAQAGYDLDALLAAKGAAAVHGEDSLIGSILGNVADLNIDVATAAVRELVHETDSVAGQTRTAASAFRDLSNSAMTAGQSAEALGAALAALGGDNITADQAALAYRQSLNSLGEALDKTGRLTLANKAAIGERVTSLKASIQADAAAGAGAGELGRKLQAQRAALIDTAAAAGIGRKATAALLNTYGLTPKLIQTAIRIQGAKEAQKYAQGLARDYNKLPKNIRLAISEIGGKVTAAKLRDLRVDGERLTNKQIKLILDAQDNASIKIARLKAKLKDVDNDRANPKVDVETGVAEAAVRNLQAAINALRDKTVTVTTMYRTVYSGPTGTNPSNPTIPRADGGIARSYGAGGFEDHRAQISPPRHPYRIWAEPETEGESYIPLAKAKRERSLQIWRQTGNLLGTRFLEFASGGIDGASTAADKGLSTHLVNQLMSNLADQFGKNSPIVAAMRSWLEKLDKGELQNGIFAKKLAELVDRQKDKAFGGFKIGEKDTVSEARSESRELLSALRQALGPDAPLVVRMTHLTDQMIAEVKERDRLRKSIDNQTQELRDLKGAMREQARTVAGNFQNDPFAEGNSLSDAITTSQADANDATKFKRALKKAKQLGLDGRTFNMLAASGNLDLIMELDTRKEVRALERAINHQFAASMGLGNFAAGVQYNPQLQDANQELRESKQELRQMNRSINQIQRDIHNGRLGRQIGRGAKSIVREDAHRSGRMAAALLAQHGGNAVSNW